MMALRIINRTIGYGKPHRLSIYNRNIWQNWKKNEFPHKRRQLDMQTVLNDFYDHQGRAEHIKKFPLSRQYANLSFIFNCIFIFLLPLGIVAEFAKLGEARVWLMIPFGTIVGWIYVVMELMEIILKIPSRV